MSNLIVLTLALAIPFGLVALVAYKMATKKKRPELKLVEAIAEEVKAAEDVVEEVVAKAKKINKGKARKGKRRAKKN